MNLKHHKHPDPHWLLKLVLAAALFGLYMVVCAEITGGPIVTDPPMSVDCTDGGCR